MEAKEKLLLIDGHSIANRAFYGVPPLTTSTGLHTNAIMGFLNIFLNAYKEFSPDYVIVAFDVHQKTFRHEIFEAYKGTRSAMPEELREQIPVLQDVLNSMNIMIATLGGYEADDILGTYARRAAENGLDVVILSGDRDILQIATDSTLIVIPKTKTGGTEVEKYYAADVVQRYGVTPSQFIDMKALMGDSSDNIPGIPGIGEKTASAIISKFDSLENAYAHADEITPPRARENLKTYIEQGRLSRVLAEINTDSPVERPFTEGRISGVEDMFNENSYGFLKRLELNQILEKFNIEKITVPESAVYTIEDAADFPANVTAPAPAGEQLSFFAQKNGRAGLFIDDSCSLMALRTEEGTTIYRGFSDNVLALFGSGCEISCFGLKSLMHAIEAKTGQEIKENSSLHDIELMDYLLRPLSSSYGYDTIGKDYLNRIYPSPKELLGKKSFAECLESSPERCFEAAAFAAGVAFEAFPIIKEELENREMWGLYTDIELPLLYSLKRMESAGVRVRKEALVSFSQSLSDMAQQLQEKIFTEAGEEFNINSPAQLGNILFEKLKLPHGKKTKTGYSTAADVLEKLAGDFPVVNDILRYRQVMKLKSTYAEGLQEFIREDGRIHGTFNQTITATGRISSTEPNLQNIPIRRELGQEIRQAFAAAEGNIFIDADYSQIELRLLAHLSEDKNLIDAYYSDADIHKVTASKVFNTPLDQVTKQQRSNAKAVNFGIVYGISSFGLGQDLSITPRQAGEYIKQYFETYPGVKDYLDATVKRAKLEGYVTTMFGRRRPIPELSSSNFMQRSFGERAAMNSPIQGTAADIIKIAMINVDRALQKAGLEARIVLQIHDELLVECPAGEAEAVKKIVYNEMKNAAALSVPLEVDVNEGADWLEAH